MQNRTTLTERVLRMDSSLKEEDILLPVDYNLTPTARRSHIDGIAVLTKDRFVVFEDGEKKKEILLSDIAEVAFRKGIGCCFIEYRDKADKWNILCRSDGQYVDFYAAAAREIGKHLEGHEISYEYEKEVYHRCPKCGRQYRPGSNICEHCVDKKQYLGRLWAIAKPYHYLIYISIVFYFIIAVANLIPPRINRILVDDYIKAETMPKLSGFVIVILAMFGMHIVTVGLSMIRSVLLIKASNRITNEVKSVSRVVYDITSKPPATVEWE